MLGQVLRVFNALRFKCDGNILVSGVDVFLRGVFEIVTARAGEGGLGGDPKKIQCRSDPTHGKLLCFFLRPGILAVVLSFLLRPGLCAKFHFIACFSRPLVTAAIA